jgi:hypothetical protein
VSALVQRLDQLAESVADPRSPALRRASQFAIVAGKEPPMLMLSRYWWMVALRGLLLLLFGLAAILWPGVTLTVLVLWIGAGFLVSRSSSAARAGHGW